MPTRILMISTHGYVAALPELGRPDTGGQVVYVLELSKALARRGYEVDILTRQFGERPAYEEVADGVQIHRVPCGGPDFIPKEVISHVLPELVRNFRCRSALADRRYDVICSHYWDAGLAGVSLAGKRRAPHLHVPHSLGVTKRDGQAWGLQGPTLADNLVERIGRERRIYHRANRIISTAEEQTRCLAESEEYGAPSDKIVQVPPGYDDALFFPVSEKQRSELKRQLNWSGKTILAAGRLAPNKGYDLLLQAMPYIRQQVPEARLVLAIGGAYPGRVESDHLRELRELAVRLNISSQVDIMPCVPQRQLADFYRAADAFVLCSRYEPFGMTAVEALACGTPTIVTTQGGLWEELRDGLDCLCCDPRDPSALARAVCPPLLHSDLGKRLSRGGIQTARSRYRWSEVAKQFVEIAESEIVRRRVATRDLKRAS